MWFTFLYATLIPIGAFISTFGLIIYYWVDKYNLLRRSCIKRDLSEELVMIMNLLDWTLLFLPLGSLIFDEQIRGGYTVSSIVMMIVAAIYLVLPLNRIVNYVDNESFKAEEKTFDEMKDKFKDNYHTAHPLRRMIFKDLGNLKNGASFLNLNPPQVSTENIIRYG